MWTVAKVLAIRKGSLSCRSSLLRSRARAPRLGSPPSLPLLDVLNKPLEATFVVIEEVEMENWG